MKTIYYDKDIPRILATKAAAGLAKRFKPASALLYTGLNAVKYQTGIPDPPLPADNWVRVRNIACGLCGTDMSFFKATTGISSAFEPIPASRKTFLGHENVGRVTEVGAGVTDLRVGDRVGIRAYMAGCDTKDLCRCRFCAEGDYNLCANYGAEPRFDLAWTGAGFGDSFIAPQQQLYRVYDEIPDELAPMIEPSAVSVHSVLQAPPKKGERVLIMGCGTIGLGIVQAAKLVEPECEIWVLSRTPAKLAFAKKLGADHVLQGDPMTAAAQACGGSAVYQGMSAKNRYFFGGFDRLYDCIGGDWANTLGVRLLAPRGTFVKVGHHMCAVTWDETPVWWQELTVVGIDAHGMERWQGRSLYTFDLVQEWIRDGRYTVEGFITHRFPLDRYKDAMKLALSNAPDVIKIVLDCQ